MSHECKEVMEALKNTKAPPPGMLRTFLLAKALRDALHDALMRMQRMLGILNLGNLMHATQRCGIACVRLHLLLPAHLLRGTNAFFCRQQGAFHHRGGRGAQVARR